MQAVITEDLVKSLKPEPKPYEVRDPRLKGFLLRVQPTGVMTYYAEYGRGKRHRIGAADAWRHRRHASRRGGCSPTWRSAAIHRRRREAKAHTLRSFLDEVYEPWAKANIRTPKNTLGRLRANFPDLQSKKLGEINAWVVEKWRTAPPEGRRQGDHRQPRPGRPALRARQGRRLGADRGAPAGRREALQDRRQRHRPIPRR